MLLGASGQYASNSKTSGSIGRVIVSQIHLAKVWQTVDGSDCHRGYREIIVLCVVCSGSSS